MTRPQASNSPAVRPAERPSVRTPGRLRLALAAAALAAVTLTACGGGSADEAGGGRGASDIAGSASGAGDSAQDAAFAAMLDEVAGPCPSGHAPANRPSAPGSSAAEPPVPPGETPPTDPIEPAGPTAGPDAELSPRDLCASGLHEERLTQALLKLKDPAPGQVRRVLNGLGYVDERIHDLKPKGATTGFLLDLREGGGRLCVRGSAAGEKTVVDTCVAPATGKFSPANVGI
ncbi:hypothetical protein AB0A76_32065 [Streptomyces exfoliatus]|uniref:Uncharacterized protein n=1 Tax=Streptomyces exfoliatus TaxID=1905 RepID=A0ABV3D5N0_STREX